MGKTVQHTDSATRQQLLQAALRSFAERGYAASSVRDIVDAAGVSKPVLYYYFKDKAALFLALVDQAHEERFRLMQEASARGQTVAGKLEQIVAALFEFSLQNRELMRLAFATAFAASGEAPDRAHCTEKGRRNYEFVRTLIEQGQAAGELDGSFSPDDLAMGIYGSVMNYVMIRLLVPECPLDRQTAGKIVRLFMEGAASPSQRLANVAAHVPPTSEPGVSPGGMGVCKVSTPTVTARGAVRKTKAPVPKSSDTK